MANIKRSAVVIGMVAVLVPLLCVEWIEAQKTSRNSFQQSIESGSNQQSVYGGYNADQPAAFSQQRVSSGFAAPVNQQRRTKQPQQQQQTYSSRPRQPSYQQTQQQPEQSASASNFDQQAEADAEPPSYGAVQGSPGTDFPNYARVPKTSFSCDGLPYDYGMYADEETGCQAYHVCYNGRKESFLCGPGTVFNQRILHCDYWYSVECGKSSQYYSSNAYMGSSQPEPGPAEANASPSAQRPVAQGSYKRTEVAPAPASRPVAPSQYQRNQPRQQAASESSFSRNTQQVQEEAY